MTTAQTGIQLTLDQLNGVVTVTRQLGVTSLQADLDAQFLEQIVRIVGILESMKGSLEVKLQASTEYTSNT